MNTPRTGPSALRKFTVQRLPRRPLCRVPRRRLPPRARRARRRVLHAGRIEGSSPAALVVAGELKVEALVRHADGDATNASPRVEVGTKGMERPVSGREPCKAEYCSQELAALVEHRLIR